MKINWNFLGGGGVQNKKPSMGGVWIFSGTAQYRAHGVGERERCKERACLRRLFFTFVFFFFMILQGLCYVH